MERGTFILCYCRLSDSFFPQKLKGTLQNFKSSTIMRVIWSVKSPPLCRAASQRFSMNVHKIQLES